ncbi:MAG: pilus assembly protein [Thermoguttaceae bacterium]|jgi:hypothetical protein|nr:pilus assembly protein [Thermoguttaceae bacterium]
MRRRRIARPRRGAATLELILAVPILLIVLVFSIQFGVAAIYQATVVHSATVAAREAGKGIDLEAVADAVNMVLGIHGIEISETTAGAKVILDWYAVPPDPGDPPGEFLLEYGDESLGCGHPDVELDCRQVRVTVCVAPSATNFCGSLCKALKPFGVSFENRMFKASSLVVQEVEQDACTGCGL